jgi:hypothetical protein
MPSDLGLRRLHGSAVHPEPLLDHRGRELAQGRGGNLLAGLPSAAPTGHHRLDAADSLTQHVFQLVVGGLGGADSVNGAAGFL